MVLFCHTTTAHMLDFSVCRAEQLLMQFSFDHYSYLQETKTKVPSNELECDPSNFRRINFMPESAETGFQQNWHNKWSLQNKCMHVYSEVNHTMFPVDYSQVSGQTIVALDNHVERYSCIILF